VTESVFRSYLAIAFGIYRMSLKSMKPYYTIAESDCQSTYTVRAETSDKYSGQCRTVYRPMHICRLQPGSRFRRMKGLLYGGPDSKEKMASPLPCNSYLWHFLTHSIITWQLFSLTVLELGAPLSSFLEEVLCKSLNDWENLDYIGTNASPVLVAKIDGRCIF